MKKRFTLNFKLGSMLKLLLQPYALLAFISMPGITIAASSETTIAEAQSVQMTEEQGADQVRMSFSAFDRTFNLLLQKNEALMENYSSRLLEVDLYAGTIEGAAGSWARVSVVSGEYSGAIYDGNELFLIDTGKAVAEAIDASQRDLMQQSGTVVYKASDMSSTLTDHVADAESYFSYDNLVLELQRQQRFNPRGTANAIAEATATQQVNVRITADEEYVATSPAGAEAQVLAQMNIVDGIFTEQVGVQFGIDEIEVLTSNGPLTSSSAGTILGQYAGFVGDDNPGLAHLFTGRDLAGSVVGVAIIGGICLSSGVAVSQTGGLGTVGALIAAHEFGHNFGSPHDNEAGSACAATPGAFLMNPGINGSDQFSDCSIEQINIRLSFAEFSTCLVDVGTPPTTPPPPPVPASVSIVTSSSPDRSNTSNLGGQTVDGAIFVSVLPDDDVDQVQFFFDGTLVTTENVAPFDFLSGTGAGANPFDTNVVADGSHAITAEILFNNGSTDSISATFNVNNTDSPAPIVSIVSSDSPDRSNSSNLSGQTVTGNIFVSVLPDSDVDQVQFFVDGSLVSTENFAPFDLQGTSNDLGNPFNTNELTNGSHTITAEIVFNDGSTDSISASFEVGNGTTTTLTSLALNEDFNSAFGGFSFEADDIDPRYTNGDRTVSGGLENSGALVTTLGGVDNSDINDIEGHWTRTFEVAQAGLLTLTVDGSLEQSQGYESDENSEIGVMIGDETFVLNTVVGDGNGGGAIGTGLQRYNIAFDAAAGSHRISLFCRNSGKTSGAEVTNCTFDNVTIE